MMTTVIDDVFHSANYSDDEENVRVSDMKKERKTAKKMRGCSYETEDDCHCKRFECFRNIIPNERFHLIQQLNDIGRQGG